MPVYELENLPKVTEPVIGTPRGLMPEPTSHLCCSDTLFSSLTAKAEREGSTRLPGSARLANTTAVNICGSVFPNNQCQGGSSRERIMDRECLRV